MWLFIFAAILIIETVAFGVIRIRGEMSGLYLCMNKRGHLVARVSYFVESLKYFTSPLFIQNASLTDKGVFS